MKITEEVFNKAFAEIEQKYIEWFKARAPVFRNQKHDMLINHWMIWDGRFMINLNSELPEIIKNECHSIVKKLAGN